MILKVLNRFPGANAAVLATDDRAHEAVFAPEPRPGPDALWFHLRVADPQPPPSPPEALRIRLAGKVDKEVSASIVEAGLGDRVVELGYCEHLDAVREQRGATLLLLPLRNDPEYKVILPGKLFEYLAARRPILGIGQEDGAMARVLEETKAGTMAGWDNEQAMRTVLDQAWKAFKAGGVPSVTADVSRYERRALTAELAKLLESVSVNNKLVP